MTDPVNSGLALVDAERLRAILNGLVAEPGESNAEAVDHNHGDYADGVRDSLVLLGLLRDDRSEIVTVDENAVWLIRSLIAHLSDHVPLTDWYVPTTLAAIEGARSARIADPTPVREVVAANVLIKATIDDQPCLLMQYDAEAHQFQLIGGKHELDDPDLAYTALREIREELDDPTIVSPADLILVPLDSRFASIGPSPTYNVISRYDISFFHAQAMRFQPSIDSLTCWVSLEDMRAGHVADGRRISTLAIDVFGDQLITLADSFDDSDDEKQNQ